MAISKKEAKRVAAVLRNYIPKALRGFMDDIFAAAKSKSFRKSLKRIEKALELPKGRVKKVGA